MFEFTRFFNMASKLEHLHYKTDIIRVSKIKKPSIHVVQMNTTYSNRYTAGFKLILNPVYNSLTYQTIDYIFSATITDIKFPDIDAKDYDDTELLYLLGKKYTDDIIYDRLSITQTHEHQIKSFIKKYNQDVWVYKNNNWDTIHISKQLC